MSDTKKTIEKVVDTKDVPTTTAQKTETKPAEKKSETKKAAPEKKPVAKKAAPAKKPANKKAPAKKPAVKKTTAPKPAAAVVPVTKIQFEEAEYDLSKIHEDVKKDIASKYSEEVKTLKIYIKPEDKKAYYVANDDFSDSINL